MCDDGVMAHAEAFALRHAATPEQHRLLETALRGRRTELRRHGMTTDDLDCVYVPRSVYAAVRGDAAPALPLTTAAYLLWAGIDLLDAVMDGDPLPDWQGRHPAEISLAAITLISAVAPLALATLDAPPATIVTMQQTLARGLLAMSAGQQRDVGMAGSAAMTVAAVEASVRGKSGEGLAMLAALAARLAGAPADGIAAYAEMGRALGTARQLRSDCHDLFVDDDSKDLANGARTLPIVWRLQQLTGDERGDFLALLDRARTEPAARDAVRAQLMEAGALQGCAVVIELQCGRARRALACAHPGEPAAQALHRRIDAASFFLERITSPEGGREPMANLRDEYEPIRELRDKIMAAFDEVLGRRGAQGVRLAGAEVDEEAYYGTLIDRFASDPNVVADLREGVTRLKRALGTYYLDAYVLTVVFQKINWNLSDPVLQAQAKDQKDRRIVW